MNQQFAIKYRPQSLNDVIGQDITVKILKNAILRGKLGSAIIFTGIRGTGKTSLARIIAKTINCENLYRETLSPCDQCQSCKAILNGQSIDVIEIDAASNTSVDDMREIIDSCKYKPVVSKYKVYIIDEVHMLSKSAFNAILKTLEEPPLHVKFIFATTDIQKVPDTILSRCLRLDLRKITEDEVFKCLRDIADKENIEIDDDSIRVIARQSSGSMRDAISSLSLVSNLDYPIRIEDVKIFLSIVDNQLVIDLLNFLIDGNLKEAIALIRKVYGKISSFKEFWLSVLEVLHYLMCLKFAIPSISDTKFSNVETNMLKKLSQKTSVFDLNNMWQIIIKGLDELTFSQNKIITSEVIIFRLCYSVKIPDIGTLMEKYPEASVHTTSLSNIFTKDSDGIIAKPNKNEITHEYTDDDIIKILESDTMIYGYFKSSCEIQKIEKNDVYIGESEKLTDSVKMKIERMLNPLKVHWKDKDAFDKDLISNMRGLFTISNEEEV